MKQPLKTFSFLLLLIMISTPALAVQNPFRSHYVCAPPLNPTITGLQFIIKESGPCPEPGRWMRVYKDKKGILMLLPSEPPVSKEQKDELSDYKKYHGIE